MKFLEETDLQKVKETALAYLHLPIHETPMSPAIVSHPFTNSGFYSYKDKETNEFKNGLLEEGNEFYTKFIDNFTMFINRSEDASEIYCLLNPPYRLGFIKYIREYLSIKDFSEIFADAWTDMENPNMCKDLTKHQMVLYFKECDKSLIMTEEELKVIEDLPDIVEVYRGITDYNKKYVKALSWTLSKKTAEWFADRFSSKGIIYKALIPKEHILAYFNGRNEKEIVLDPKYLQNIQIYKDLSK